MEKSIKGQVSEVENIIQSIISRFDIVDRNDNHKKPSMYNLWMIHDAKVKKENITEMFKKLSENNFCKESEVERLHDELTRMQKVRLAVLPKNCVDSVICDLRQIIQSCDFEFVLNEYVE